MVANRWTETLVHITCKNHLLFILVSIDLNRFDANKHIFFAHFLSPMRSMSAAFILLLALITSAQCQQTTEDWYNKGYSLYEQGKYEEAIKAYDEAIRLDPNLAQAWNNKGEALRNQGKSDAAIKAYDEAIRLDPNYAQA